jgi:hypothetical protein
MILPAAGALALASMLVGFVAYVATRLAAGGAFLASAAGDLLDNPLAVLGVGRLLVRSRFGAPFWLTIWPHRSGLPA